MTTAPRPDRRPGPAGATPGLTPARGPVREAGFRMGLNLYVRHAKLAATLAGLLELAADRLDWERLRDGQSDLGDAFLLAQRVRDGLDTTALRADDKLAVRLDHADRFVATARQAQARLQDLADRRRRAAE